MAIENKKRSRTDPSSSSTKKPRPSSDNATAGPSKSAPRPAPAFTSALKTDEGDFPRGGGSSLTAFELKQVREEGCREAEAELAAESGSRPSKKPKRNASEREARRMKKNEVKPANDFDKDQIRAEHLNYKRLTVGTRVLARIHTILPLHLVLSLPNNLLAHVPITEISSTLTSLLTAEQEAMASSDDEEDDDEEQTSSLSGKRAPELAQIFSPGQYFPARVITTYPTASQAFISQYPVSEMTRLAARVEMTLMPEKVNGDVVKAELAKGYVLVGEVKEEEDKGWTVALGLGDEAGGNGIGGWIAKDQVTKHMPSTKLVPGQLVRAAVSSLTAGGRVIQLTLDPQAILKGQLNEVSNVGSILPGHLVSALITAVMPSGLNLKIGGFFDGTIDLAHLNLGDAEIEEKYSVGKKIKARVLYDNQSITPRRFGLSALPHIIDLRSPLASDKTTPLEQAVPIGKMINTVTVTKVINEWGLQCRTDDGLDAFVHISHISDDRLPSLSSSAGPYAPGTLHRARVIGHSPLDGVLLLSLEQKVIDQVFMSVSELHIGQLLKGTIRRLTDTALFIDISGSVDGVVHPLHYADIRLKHPERRFKVGSSVKARILDLEPARSRVVLTLKKSLVESQSKVLERFEDYAQGVVVPGTVMKLLDKGLVVELFGGLKAFVPQSEASQNFTSNLSDILYVGQPTQIRIIEVQPSTRRLTGSIRQALPSALAAESLDIGHSVSGNISQIHAEQVVITLQPSQVTALLSISNLSNHRHQTIDESRQSLKVGEKVDGLVIVSKNEKSGLYIVSYPRTPASLPTEPNAKTSTTDKVAVTWSTVQIGHIITGKVVRHSTLAALVQISGLRGRLHACDISDDYSSVSFPQPEGPLNIGDTVQCSVLKVDSKAKTLELSSRQSKVLPQAQRAGVLVKDPEVGDVEDLKVGNKIRGFVKNVAGGGVFVALGRGMTARVMIKELFDDYVKDWQSKFTIGQLVSGKILKVDTNTNLVEMTFRTKPSTVNASKKTAQLSLSDFTEGQTVVAVVKKIEEFGIFLRIEGSNVSGLCHKSEITDNKKADVASALKGFRIGDQVKAKIVKVDTEKGRVSFGLKASYFGEGQEGEDDEDAEMGSEEGEEDEEEDEADEKEGEDDEEDGEEGEEGEDGEGDEDDEVDDEEASDEEGGEAAGDEDKSDDEDIAIQVDQPSRNASTTITGKAKGAAPSAALDVSGGFDWSASALNNDDAQSSSDEDDEEEPVPIATTIHPSASASKTQAKSQKYDLTATAPDAQPESSADFERALLASPNSSFLWIQYMSFLLQLHEVDKARRIGRQALEKIGYREEDEKLNVWMALVNLELGFGSAEAAEKVLKEASQYNDARTVWARYAEALQVAGKDEMAEETYRKIVKKFSAYPESWLSAATFYLKKGDIQAARELLPRSLKSLDQPKHVEMIEKMAILEFKHGEAERGKTLFEGLLDKKKRKMALWSVYIDQMARIGDIQGVRSLFDRALDQKLTSKKAKFLFKKWLAIENRIGDTAGQDNAKERAKAWVLANVRAEEDGEGDEEEEEE